MRRPRSYLGLALATAVALAITGCGGDDGAPPATDAATVDGPSDDGPATGDAAACNLPTTIITCTIGSDAPCTAVCGGAYCYTFNRVGTVCTRGCTVVGDCPAGWACNAMGRCRPPG